MQPLPIFSANGHPLQTRRLWLEPLRAGHAEEAWPHLDDERMWRFFPLLRPRSLEHVREIYARRQRGYPASQREEVWENWLARDRTSGNVVGDVQATIRPERLNACIAYSTYAAHQRRGYAREAVAAVIEHLRTMHGLRRLMAEIHARNLASYRLIESLGFTRTKTTGEEYTYERSLVKL